MVQDMQGLLQQKAEIKEATELRAQLARLDEVMSWKVDRTSLEELAASVQLASQLINQKSDLSYVNATNAKLQKLTACVSQNERLLYDTAAALNKLESHHLPQTVQRTRELLSKTNHSLKLLQEAVAMKADQQTVEELAAAERYLENCLSCKANQQALLELNATVHNIQDHMLQKVDTMVFDELQSKFQRVCGQVTQKVEHHHLQSVTAGLQEVQQYVSQKADLHLLNEAKLRMTSLETLISDKAHEHQVHASINCLKEDFSSKANKYEQGVAHLSQALERLQLDVGQKLDARTFHEIHMVVKQLSQAIEMKADLESVTRLVDQLNHRFDNVVDQLRHKADHTSLEETAATTHMIMEQLSMPRPQSLKVERSCMSSHGSASTLSTMASSQGAHSPVSSMRSASAFSRSKVSSPKCSLNSSKGGSFSAREVKSP